MNHGWDVSARCGTDTFREGLEELSSVETMLVSCSEKEHMYKQDAAFASNFQAAINHTPQISVIINSHYNFNFKILCISSIP